MSLLHCQNLAAPPLTLVLYPGSRVLLPCPSNATTRLWLRFLNRLREPTAGTVLWRGQELATWPVATLRQQVLLVPEVPFFFGLTVEETIAYPLKLRRWPHPQIQANLSYWLERMELPRHWYGLREFELSLGDRQWVVLTRALVAAPQLFLLEEPLKLLATPRQALFLQLLDAQTEQAVLMVHPAPLPAPWVALAGVEGA